MKKISILIANYNNGNFFKDCYLSILNQTYKNWEVIIVDDASTDNSVAIIRETIKGDERFQFYESKENRGCGFTKRKCMEYAIGEICCYLDPDDALYPTALEKSIEKYTRPDTVATYSKMMMCDERLSPTEIFSNTKLIYNNVYFFNCPIQFAHFFTFKREAYLKTQGINPNLKSAVDQDLYLKILEQGEVGFINEVLYKYRLHKDGISQQSSKQNAKDSFAYVIHDTMKRRGIKVINHQKVPDTYEKSEEIYNLLNYQTHFLYRLKMKFKLLLQNLNIFIVAIFVQLFDFQYLINTLSAFQSI